MEKVDKVKIVLSMLAACMLVLGVFGTVNFIDRTDKEPLKQEEEPVDTAEIDTINGYQITAGEYEIIIDEEGFHRIIMLTPGYGVIDSPGDPALPEKILEFQVPNNIDWLSLELTVDLQESEVLQGQYDIAPNPPYKIADNLIVTGFSVYEDWGYDKSILGGKNMKVYGKDSNYPQQSIELLPYTERKERTEFGTEKVKFIRLAYRPFLYKPISQELTLIESANIHISYGCHPTPSPPLGPSSTYDYIIITTNDIVANSDKLGNFINLKELTHDVLVVTEDDFDGLTGQAPNGRAEKIRQWLKDNEPTYNIDYVLLIGNPDPDDPTDPVDFVGDIPMKYCWPNYFSWKCWDDPRYRGSPTDWFYADLSGDWDLDGDQLYGECLDLNHEKSPDPTINEDYFSVNWTGFIHCDFNEVYKFHIFSDGGVRLSIDGNLVIDNWDDLSEHPPTSDYYTTPAAMSIGNHAIILEYKEHTGHGIIQLFWETVGTDDVEHHVIPMDHLRNESDTADGLTGRFYNNIFPSGSPDLVKADGEEINFIWGTGDRESGGPDNGAEVSVGRIPVYNDNYTQLDEILQKIIVYETDPGDISWRKSILLPMEPMDDNTPCCHLGEGIKNDIADPAGFKSFRIYDEDYNPPTPDLWPCNKSNVLNEWKNGYGMVTWATHGGPTGATDIFDSDLTIQLDDSKPAFTCQASCLTSYPENDNNLAYALLKHGGIAMIGATRVSFYSGGNWTTYNPNEGHYEDLDYFYTKGVITDGLPAGDALAQQKAPIPEVGYNEMDFILYGDPDCYLLTVVPNAPPEADAGGPYIADEGSPVTFDGSGSYDPDGYPAPLEYRWDFNGDGDWDTTWSSIPTANFTWSDDYTGTVVLEVSDSVLTDTDIATVTVNNVAPTITPFGPFMGDEPLFILISTSATDPGSDDLTFTWEFALGPTTSSVFYNDGSGPDSADSYIGGVYPFSATDSTSHEYGDNGNYSITLTVEDDNGGVAVYTSYILVYNVAPTIEKVEAYILVNFTLRAAGEKWHNVEMYILENDVKIGYAEVIRYPGSPDDQSVTLYNIKCNVTSYINVTVLYTPADDPVNGQPNGATPVWVTMDFEDGEDIRLHHTCNVKHPETWNWTIGVNQYFVGHNITFEGTASDPGSDDLTFDWFWDDSSPNTVTIYYNNDVSPDPLPSPDGIYPVSVLDVVKHMFMANGNYNVQLTVTDDDGDLAVVVIFVIMV